LFLKRLHKETLTNSETIKNGFIKIWNEARDIAQHFVAVSTNMEKVTEFGINPDNVFQCGIGLAVVFHYGVPLD
jgi:glucose-6-phosphate isomerase